MTTMCKDGRALWGKARTDTGAVSAWRRHEQECDICSGRLPEKCDVCSRTKIAYRNPETGQKLCRYHEPYPPHRPYVPGSSGWDFSRATAKAPKPEERKR